MIAIRGGDRAGHGSPLLRTNLREEKRKVEDKLQMRR